MAKKFYLLLIGIMLFGLNAFAQSEIETKSTPSFSLETVVANKYAWRGILYDQGFVIQPTLGVEYKNWTLQLWGNIAAVEEDGFAKNHELDYLLQYTFEFGDLTLSPFLQLYTYPDKDEDSALELSLACDYNMGAFTISSILSRDIKLGIPYLFGDHCISFEKELNEKLILNTSAGFGWGTEKFNLYYVGIGKSAVNYFFASASLSYFLNDKICAKPFAESYLLTDREIKNLTNDSLVNFGLSISVGF
ncbi:MAG: hypothetical protein FD122_2516 [Stygiobacter sp.]|nr:MAG: hypothetical protein FD122_2516 [Stygiobacter sp.]